MRGPARALAALAALLALGLLALALALPRIAASDAVRARLEGAVRGAGHSRGRAKGARP